MITRITGPSHSLVYKCDIAIPGGLLVIVAILDILMNPIAGYLQDKEILDQKGFPVRNFRSEFKLSSTLT